METGTPLSVTFKSTADVSEPGDSEESGESGDEDDSGESGLSGDYDDSGESGESGDEEESGESGDSSVAKRTEIPREREGI